uniref:Enhancer of mRNA-decapping protein 4 n=1 Tax=Steinernema glaseri TaxID=37863 RepID=A0A1I7Y3D2_9BILA
MLTDLVNKTAESVRKPDFSACFADPSAQQRFARPPGASGNPFQGFITSQCRAPLPAEKTILPPTDPSVVVPIKIEASGSKEVSMTFEQLVRKIARAQEILLENLKQEVLQEYAVTLDMKTINILLDTTCRIPLAAFRMSGRVKGLIEACALPGSKHIKL